MRPINVTLDSVTWEYAKEKSNFSAWVRGQLRSERNKRDAKPRQIDIECVFSCGRSKIQGYATCEECMPRIEGEEE